MQIQWYIIFAAFVLDFILGDPRILPHPIIYMGKAIDFFENKFRIIFKNLLISGFLFSGFLILSTWIIAFVIVKVCISIHPVLGGFPQARQSGKQKPGDRPTAGCDVWVLEPNGANTTLAGRED